MKKIFVLFAALAATVSLMAQTTNQVSGTCGKTVTITATPDDGYEFDHWQDGNTQNPRQIVISADSTIWTYQATFRPKQMTVVATANEADWGSVTGAGSGLVGSQMTLTAVAANGCYRFKQWSDGVTTASRTITVGTTDAENTYEAIFEEVTFDVNVTAGQHGSVSISIED